MQSNTTNMSWIIILGQVAKKAKRTCLQFHRPLLILLLQFLSNKKQFHEHFGRWSISADYKLIKKYRQVKLKKNWRGCDYQFHLNIKLKLRKLLIEKCSTCKMSMECLPQAPKHKKRCVMFKIFAALSFLPC